MIPRFRVFDKFSKKIIPGGECLCNYSSFEGDDYYEEFLVTGDGEVKWYFSESYEKGLHGLQENRFILMQSTGLKDKNGKEIFDGDILERDLTGDLDYGRGKVYWDLLLLTWVIKYAGDSTEDLLCEESIDEIEIIGNIYETPKLLET